MGDRWKRSTGEIRNTPGGRRARARLKKVLSAEKSRRKSLIL
jgi:hypothetical protein